jgi:hypothetical protein
VNDFAMADAAKISDMDRDRAAALAGLLPGRGRAYVECGAIHQDMVGLMIRAWGMAGSGRSTSWRRSA